MSAAPAWICCQLGAREHYAVARAMQRQQALGALVTDAWAPPGSLWTMLPGDAGKRLAERYSPELATATVVDLTGSLVAHEATWQLRGLSGWALALARNEWFQERAAAALPRVVAKVAAKVLFAHSYSALGILRQARSLGLTIVLGQIDPGPEHFELARSQSRQWPEFGPPLSEPPADYFDRWREECALADRIVVNSDWSRALLMRAGIDEAKIHIIPLPYQAEAGEAAFERRYPQAFDADRPLRVLFVGSIATAKGVPELLASLDLLGDAPIELSMVGPMAATIPERFRSDRRVRWVGAVSRSAVMEHYRQADVLVFPSHSDGFGMAQIEAREWRLPIVASRSSGRVVDDGVNGLLLPEVTAEAIAAALRGVMDPAVLSRFSSSASADTMTLDRFGQALGELVRP